MSTSCLLKADKCHVKCHFDANLLKIAKFYNFMKKCPVFFANKERSLSLIHTNLDNIIESQRIKDSVTC